MRITRNHWDLSNIDYIGKDIKRRCSYKSYFYEARQSRKKDLSERMQTRTVNRCLRLMMSLFFLLFLFLILSLYYYILFYFIIVTIIIITSVNNVEKLRMHTSRAYFSS